MDKITKNALLMGALLVTGVSMAQQRSALMQEAIEQIRKEAIVIAFYGKVIDQYGQPVVGASVKVKVTGFEEKPPIIALRTNENGLFRLSRKRGIRGHKLYVTSIEKDGYEFSMRSDPDPYGFNYTGYTPTRPNGFVPDANNPIVYTMRKKGKVKTYMLDSHIGLSIDLYPPQSEEGIDFVNKRVIKNPAAVSKNNFVDLLVSGVYDVTKGWTVRFTIPSQAKGICVSHVFLDKAPADGWQSDYVVQGTDFDLLKQPIYLYTKSRNPEIYGRLFIRSIPAGKGPVSFGVKVQVNPYGDTVMEPDEDIPVMLEIQLRNEAQEALRTGHLAVRPAHFEQLKQAVKGASDQELRRALTAAIDQTKAQLLTLHIDPNTFTEDRTPNDQWLLTYKIGTNTVTKTVAAITPASKAQWIRMNDVNDLGGELRVSYQSGSGMPQPWAYLSGLNQREINLPQDANFVAYADKLVPVTLRCADLSKLKPYHALGLFENRYAKLPLYQISVDDIVKNDQGNISTLRVMPGSYTVKGIGADIEHPVAIGQIKIGKNPNAVYDLGLVKQ